MTSSPELARAVAATLARHVTDVVICPGSRNSPLSLELIARDDIRVHTRIDERSAAFLALGLARSSKRHVAVVTTSGTAVANCAPAMIEAAYSHTPLIMVSADRPERLHGTGANQTIEQRGIFNVVETDHVVDVADLNSISFARNVIHINVALDVPLVDTLPDAGDPVERVREVIEVDHGEVVLNLNQRILVVAGDEAWEVPGLEDVPTIAEPSAPAPYHPVHPLAAQIFAHKEIKPEHIVVVGHPTLHRAVLSLLADVPVTVLTKTDTITGNPQAVGSRVKVTGELDKRWLQICEDASTLCADRVKEVLEGHGFTGLHVAAAVADTMAVGDTLFLGASNPVRDASLVGMPLGGVDIFAARGAAGIDGTVSQAVGVALDVQHRDATAIRADRTVALMGDVTFLHDVGGLLGARPENLTIVVANDDGCGIFETLEIGAPEFRPSFEQVFGTPHGVHIEAIAQAYGVNYLRAETLPELIEALIDTTDSAGFNIIEAVTTRSTRRDIDKALTL